MKIIKTDVRTYLREHLKLREDVDIPTIENDYQLDKFINADDSNAIWSYSIEELDYLLDREKDNQVEETFVLMFEELWEVPSDE